MPAAGSQIQIGSPRPQIVLPGLASEQDRRVGADRHEEGVTERHLPGDAGQEVEAEGADGEDRGLD